MKSIILFTATLLILLFACKKEDIGPDYISVSNPDEIIVAVSPAKNAVDIGIDTSLLVRFSAKIFQNYTSLVGTTNQMIRINSVRFFTDDLEIETSNSFLGWDEYTITPNVQLERGSIYTLWIKTHYVLWVQPTQTTERQIIYYRVLGVG